MLRTIILIALTAFTILGCNNSKDNMKAGADGVKEFISEELGF